MANYSTYLRNAINQHFLKSGGSAAITQPTSLYVGLFNGDPGPDGTSATECSYTNYARVQIAFGASSSGATSNTNDVLFPANGGASAVTVAGIGIFDQSTGGNLLFHGTATSKTLNQNDKYDMAAGQITVTNS